MIFVLFKIEVLNKRRIIILAASGVSTDILFNSLKNNYDIEAVILEKPVPPMEFLKKRIKKLGIRKVIGQILFQSIIAQYLKLVSIKRKQQILKYYNLTDFPIPEEKIIRVNSVNASYTLEILQKLNPGLVIVNGTRIISREILNCIPVKFVNIHAGITPKYRNVHGAYWALVNNDLENCGVTVHIVDAGIDTGDIIYQQRIQVTKKDNFSTYPLLQLAEGLLYLKKAIPAIFENKIVCQKKDIESKMWYHPTFGEYLYYWLMHGKK